MITDERLQELRRLAQGATPGPWYGCATDDDVFKNARYISTEPGREQNGTYLHDGVRGMDACSTNQADNKHVLAITLLQSPRLARCDRFEENTHYIAAANPATMIALLDEIERLRAIRDASREHATPAHLQDGERFTRLDVALHTYDKEHPDA